MNKFYILLLTMILVASTTKAQNSYLTAGNNFSTLDVLSDFDMLSTFDLCNGNLYAHTGDTIVVIDMATESELVRYGKPSGYNAFPSFVYANPSQNEIWAGFTVTGNSDDRIYRIDTETGLWEHKATLTGNFDMEIVNGKLIVDGAIYGDENIIYLLDTTGTNNHRAIIETTGNSAGIATDAQGNLYYATSTMDVNVLVKWSNTDLATVLYSETAEVLQMSVAQKLSDLPAGAYDCDVDQAGNVVFNINDYSSNKIVAMWNGTPGDGSNYDTLAYTADDMDWLTMIKTTGNVLDPGAENGAFVLSYARPIAKITGTNLAPQLTQAFETIQKSIDAPSLSFNLNDYFTDPDDDNQFSYAILSNSFPDVAQANIDNSSLTIAFAEAGQTTLTIKAENAGRFITTQIVVGVHNPISDEFTLADFEDLDLETNSYWNGSEGDGFFQTNNTIFSNNYNTEYGSWSQWAYSSVTDNTTAGWSNQYSAITGGSFEAINSNTGTYGVSYASAYEPPVVKFADQRAHMVKGFYVTNSTYAALSMRDGDAYSKKFGGATGIDPDWLKLSVYGFHNGENTDTITFYLADYRFDNNAQDYIIQTWQWIELSQLGYVDSLQMLLSSSDVGQWGMNTPAYFCADNFYIGQAETGLDATTHHSEFNVYPNPTNEQFSIQLPEQANGDVTISDVTGKVMMQVSNARNQQTIDVSRFTAGLYLVQWQSGNRIITKRLIKQ